MIQTKIHNIVKNRNMKPILIIILMVSILFIGLGVFELFRAFYFVRKAISTQGIIVRYEKGGQRGNLYTPIFTFHDKQGKRYEVISSISTNYHVGEIGERKNIIYDSNNPQKAEIYEFLNIWGFPLLSIGMGILGFGIIWIIKLIIMK